MHEMSIALEVCRIATDRLGPLPGTALVEVGMEVGDDAGIEPANLEFCLGALLDQPPFRHAALTMRRVPGDVLRVAYLEVDDERTDD